jgi:hypothetical protein
LWSDAFGRRAVLKNVKRFALSLAAAALVACALPSRAGDPPAVPGVVTPPAATAPAPAPAPPQAPAVTASEPAPHSAPAENTSAPPPPAISPDSNSGRPAPTEPRVTHDGGDHGDHNPDGDHHHEQQPEPTPTSPVTEYTPGEASDSGSVAPSTNSSDDSSFPTSIGNSNYHGRHYSMDNLVNSPFDPPPDTSHHTMGELL